MKSSCIVTVFTVLDCAGAVQFDAADYSPAAATVGSAWSKIYQIQDGSNRNSDSFPLTTGSYGSITSEIGSSHAKLSDSQINAMAVARDGYSHVYQIKSSDCSYYLYVRSNDNYVDTSSSFGVTYDNTRVCLASSYESCSTWATLRSTEHGIDLLYTSPVLGGESCCRYFFGHGTVDCWTGPSGYRCVNGGDSCYGYKKLDDVVFYIWGGSAATPSPTPYPTPNPTSYPTPYPTPYPTLFPTPYPTPFPTPYPTAFPTPYPTPYPTLFPTPYPTPFPTPYPTAFPTPYPASEAAATGDPHLQNVHGERFDLMKPGKHVLIHIPRGSNIDDTLLRVQADARRLGGQCADIYFQGLNVTGRWADAKQVGGYHYNVSQSVEKAPQWVVFGKVELKVVHGRTGSGVLYLNVYVKHLGRAGFAVGGLLGEDDHKDAMTPPAFCAQHTSLNDVPSSGKGFSSASAFAVATLA